MQTSLPLDEMTITEKLVMINQIWGNLMCAPNDVPSPEWHREVLSARAGRVKSGEAQFKGFESVKSDLREGAQFCEKQSDGLGLYFLDTLFSDIESLILYAGVHIKLDGYFRLLSKRFPFAVYYSLGGDTAKVYAALDCRKNPSITIEQLKQRRT